MIKRLVIKDCLGIEELAINPGKVNVITGGNEKGKTSILESIEKALYNTKRRAKFVRAGAEKAYIELETDDGLSIRRTVKEDEAGLDSGSVKITKDGQPIKKAPETFLKELFGFTSQKSRDVFAFNPVDFMQKKDTEQTDILLSLLPIKVTSQEALEWFGQAPKVNYEKHGLQVLKDLEQWFYDARHEANTRLKATEDEVTAIRKRLPDNYSLSDWENINLGNLFAEVAAAEQNNRDIQDNKAFVDRYDKSRQDILNKYLVKENETLAAEEKEFQEAKKEIEAQKKDIGLQIETTDAEIEELKNQIIALEKKRATLQITLDNLDKVNLAERRAALSKITKNSLASIDEQRKKELEDLSVKKGEAAFFLETRAPISLIPLKEKCETTEKMKSYIPLAKESQALNNRLVAEVDIAMKYDKCVETARLKPIELLATVELPVKGLGIDGKGIVVTIGGLPLSNLSTAQQVRACLDIARVLAKDNPLKLICIDKVEHLDETVRAEFLTQIEADEGYQYFVTLVSDGELKIDTRG